ncbi:TPA: hypothetical protein NV433_004733 [Citrobacter freundii]|nr:hypothetical protein [Citrobacter freundii]
MTALNKQALRQLATDAHELGIIKRYTKGIEANKRFAAIATPLTFLALLDELEESEGLRLKFQAANCELCQKLEAAERVNAELSKAASVSSQWKPDVCPITGRNFFMWINHPKHGYVPTYGGPFDSYTIPVRDSDGEFSCERYDHDCGNWREGECVDVTRNSDDRPTPKSDLRQFAEKIADDLQGLINLLPDTDQGCA